MIPSQRSDISNLMGREEKYQMRMIPQGEKRFVPTEMYRMSFLTRKDAENYAAEKLVRSNGEIKRMYAMEVVSMVEKDEPPLKWTREFPAIEEEREEKDDGKKSMG